jgi:hypothetical protein
MEAIWQQANGNRADTQVAELSASRNGGLDLSLLVSRGQPMESVGGGEPEVKQITFGILPLTTARRS